MEAYINNCTNNAIILCSNVRKSFIRRDREIQVLKGINFSAEAGKIHIIYGKSGCGKSTLLNLIGGLDSSSSGSIEVDGCSYNMLSNEKLALLRRDKIGFIFQNFNLVPSWTAFENVESALLHRGIPRQERRQRAELMLEGLGLEERLDNLPSELSVGQQQRVAIARALINEPKIILADEPTGDVDPETAEQIIELLVRQVKESGLTLIIATHGDFPINSMRREDYNMYMLEDGFIKQVNAVKKFEKLNSIGG